jgi:C_GCAxxG_C_C family probable redox protein
MADIPFVDEKPGSTGREAAMDHGEKARGFFASGSSCSQSVFAAFAPDFGIDASLAHRLSAGLGGGCGRKQYLCGAVSGAALVLGLAFGNSEGFDAAAKEACYARVHTFISEIEKEFGASDCRALLGGNDTSTQEGRDAVKLAGFSKKVCSPLVERAVAKLDAILGASGIADEVAGMAARRAAGGSQP